MLSGLKKHNAKEEGFKVQATWIWNPAVLVREEAATLAFLKNNKVNKVYIQIDGALPYKVYQSFIEKADADEIKICALDGAPDWSAAGPELGSLLRWFKDYQHKAKENQKFTGLHLDIEPYLCKDWNRNRTERIEAYQAVLEKAKNAAGEMGICFEADLPFWFDEILYDNKSGKGRLAEWVIANTDSVTIMAYRNTAEAIIEISKNEIAFAAEQGKAAVIAVETEKSAEGSHISFDKKGECRMYRELQAVKRYHSNSPGFGGTAIHHYGSWTNMKK